MGELAAPVDIALLIADPETRARLRTALSPFGTPFFATSATHLLHVVATHRVGSVVLEPQAANGATTSVTRALRDGFPSLPILLYCELKAEHVKQVPALVQAGADTLIIRGIDDCGLALRHALARSSTDRVAGDALRRLEDLVPAAERSVLAFCLAHSYRRLRVKEVAKSLRVHRRTLSNRALATSLPPPSALISWCRLMHAARLLDDSARSVEQVSLALDFGSGTSLRNMLRRYTGLRPTELRRGGAFDKVITLLRERIASRSSGRTSIAQRQRRIDRSRPAGRNVRRRQGDR